MAVTLSVAATVFMRPLRRFADETDRQQAALLYEREKEQIQSAVELSAAEDTRVMHDTLINTLGAIAAGGISTASQELIRDRCARDADDVDALLRGRRPVRSDRATLLASLTQLPKTMTIVQAGLDSTELKNVLDLVPEAVLHAVQGAIEELIRNIAKHSEADLVTINSSHDGSSLVVTVADNGRGFDGELVRGHGLAESVVARARDAGVNVTIETSPGAGTSTTLKIPFRRTEHIEAANDASHANLVVQQVRKTACWTWSVLVVTFGLVSVTINLPRAAGAYAALGLISLLSFVAWWFDRKRTVSPRLLTVSLIAGVPVSLIMGLATINPERGGILGWPTITMTPLLVVLLTTRRSVAPFLVGSGVLLALDVIASAWIYRSTASDAWIVLSGTAIQLAILSAWFAFHRLLGIFGRERTRIQNAMTQDRIEKTARELAEQARTRWTVTAEKASRELLRPIALGHSDPNAPDVRSQCALAERYLRQLLLIDPGIVHLSRWIGQALADAYTKNVYLTLRGAAEDASTADSAERIGRVMLAAIDALGPGMALTAGIFRTAAGLRLLLVAPRTSLRSLRPSNEATKTLGHTYQQLKDQDLIELTVP